MRNIRKHAAQSVTTAVVVLLMTACGGEQPQQTMFNPVGPMSSRIENLWWFIFAIALAVFVIVIALFTMAASKRKVYEQVPPLIHPDPAAERARATVVTVATVISTVLLFAILVHSTITGKYMNSLASKNPVSIEVIGHQWWWEVRYPNTQPSLMVTTANEIHVPTGTPVVLQTSSSDVIHSFWAPNIQGKRDLIPGYSNAIWFQVDKAGTYRGQCAEFCGHEHAKMGFYVIAETPQQFQAWMDGQRKPATDPADEVQKHGRDVFEKSTCVMCHTIRGTVGGSRVGPDLTHVGSRMSLAAATLPNTPGTMGGWIADPQTIKPGVLMPPNALKSSDLQALVQYLESLK